MEKLAFYLKINRREDYAFKNLSRWIDLSYLLDADCYILCDDETINKRINESLLVCSDITYLQSDKSENLSFVVNSIANRNWVNAAYAHLTTFWHAQGKYKRFWNIDADDTRMCVSIDRMAEIISGVQQYADDNYIDCFSLDMWRSETEGRHWSFGVTYVNAEMDWFSIFRQHCNDKDYYLMDNEGNQNIDWFFTYLKYITGIKIESYYIENLRFIHYSNDFLEKPVGSGLYHWKNGELVYPIVLYGFGVKEIGKYKIAEDVIKFDFNVSDDETSGILTYYAREGKDLSKFYDVDQIVNDDICHKKFIEFKKKHGFSADVNPEIVCFGAGNALEKNLKKIRHIYDLRYVCDNDSNKWGKEIFDGIKCISPDELANMENVIVIILVYSKRIVLQIEEQLKSIGLKYDYMDNWLACVE